MDRSVRYQPEIDGLRAVAITAAVLYHAKLPGFTGGFVGVDVFFVISGFLITRMLLAELIQTGKIDFLAFYARRIRRLWPALVAVVVVILALGSFVLTAAGERQDLSVSAAATIAFVSNFYFWRAQASYFAGPAEWLPLLNMWTLSVEEQFYLIWPLLLALAGAVARTTRFRMPAIVAAVLIILFSASLAVFLWGATAKPTAAFYLTPTRIWEFALGGALALAGGYLHRLERIAGPAALIGLAAIVISIVFLRRGVSFSGTIFPAAFGAAAVIGGVSVMPASLVGRVLAAAPLVVVGKLSYSWYLWHWPLLALARVYDFGQQSLARDLLVVFASLGLSALTYAFIENPVRRRKPWPFSGARQTVLVGGGMSFAVAGLAIALYIQADAAAQRDPWLSAIYAARNAEVHSPPSCHLFARFSRLPPAQACLVGAAGAPPRMLIWGDSHAEHFVEMIREDGARNGYAAVARTMSACPPFLPMQSGQTRMRDSCLKFNNAVADEIPMLVRAGVTGIVLASRQYGFGGRLATPTDVAVWKEGLRGVLSLARRSDLRVLVIAPVPTFRFPVADCLAHLTAERCGIGRMALAQTRSPLVAALGQIVAEFDNARLWDPINSFCDDSVCAPVRDGVILYSDLSHLSVSGSRGLAPVASSQLGWLRQ